LKDAATRMSVNVNKAGRYYLAFGVENAGRRFGYGWRDFDNRVAAYRKIGAVPRAARSVDDSTVLEHQVISGFLCIWRVGKCEKDTSENCGDRELAQWANPPEEIDAI
jgi:hypothetical protein